MKLTEVTRSFLWHWVVLFIEGDYNKPIINPLFNPAKLAVTVRSMHDLPKYQIQAFWDQKAEVWVAQSEDILGLVTESSTLEQLTLKLRQMIPELLAANHCVTPADIIFELITRREESISVHEPTLSV